MTPNVGGTDRGLRLALGAALILMGLLAGVTGIGQWLLLIVGAVMVLTALVRFCPAYRLLGISTCARK